ncbi:MAG: biotin/lipoyl-containing protein [Kiloniellales bacterium]
MATKVKLESPGSIWKLLVSVGDRVSAGDTLFIMEIMKMEVPHTAPVDGTIAAIHIAEGDEGLEEDMLAIEIEP